MPAHNKLKLRLAVIKMSQLYADKIKNIQPHYCALGCLICRANPCPHNAHNRKHSVCLSHWPYRPGYPNCTTLPESTAKRIHEQTNSLQIIQLSLAGLRIWWDPLFLGNEAQGMILTVTLCAQWEQRWARRKEAFTPHESMEKWSVIGFGL